MSIYLVFISSLVLLDYCCLALFRCIFVPYLFLRLGFYLWFCSRNNE